MVHPRCVRAALLRAPVALVLALIAPPVAWPMDPGAGVSAARQVSFSPFPQASEGAPEPVEIPEELPPPPETPRLLAFLREGDIWLMTEDGENAWQITALRAAGFPRTNRSLASFRWLANGELLWVVTAWGSGEKSLLVDLEGNVLWERTLGPLGPVPYWAPDGEVVAIVSNTSVRVEDRNGRSLGVTRFPGLQHPLEGPRVEWSPNGERFVYVEGEVFVVHSREGQRLRGLSFGPEPTQAPIRDRRLYGPPSFFGDGESLYVSASTTLRLGQGPFQIFEVSMSEDVPPEAFTSEGAAGLPPIVPTSDGNRLAYGIASRLAGGCQDEALKVFDFGRGEPAEIRPTAFEPSRRAVGPGRSAVERLWGFDWSPAGDTLIASFELLECASAFELPQTLARGLFLWNLETGQERQLLDWGVFPRFSPDGGQVAFTDEPVEEEVATLWVVDVASGTTRPLGPGARPTWQG